MRRSTASGSWTRRWPRPSDSCEGAPVPTDGPFAEAKESLAGYYLVDVESEARALEIASKIVGHVQEPIEVRRIADGPPEEYTS